MKLLNTIEALTFFGEEIPSYTAFQLNNIACCHLRMKKFNLAAYYLSKVSHLHLYCDLINIPQALGIVQKLSRESSSDTKKYERVLNLNAVQHYPVLLHNYALVFILFFANKLCIGCPSNGQIRRSRRSILITC